jgi:hypothetical protein
MIWYTALGEVIGEHGGEAAWEKAQKIWNKLKGRYGDDEEVTTAAKTWGSADCLCEEQKQNHWSNPVDGGLIRTVSQRVESSGDSLKGRPDHFSVFHAAR